MKFDKKKLPEEITELLKIDGVAQAYTISLKLNEWLEENSNPDVNTLLCAAHFTWACAELTELDDDVIGFGEETISLLEKALLLDPGNEEALKNKSKLEKKVKKARKEQEAILEWEKGDLEDMDKDVLSELAFYYFGKADRNPEFAEKGYRYYQKIYEYDLLENELPQDALYHFASMAYCKYYAEGYESARELVEKTLDWKLDDKYKLYDYKLTDVWVLQWRYLADIDDYAAFEKSFRRWYETMKRVKPDEEPNSFDHRNLTPIVQWLVNEKKGTNVLNYILKNCYPSLVRNKIDLTNYGEILKIIQ